MTKQKKAFVLIWLVACSAFVLVKGIVPGSQEGRSDFSNYYSSTKLIIKGESISNFYNNEWFSDESIEAGVNGGAKFSPFPPITAYLMLPLSGFSEITAKRLWLVLNVLFLILFAKLFQKFTMISWLRVLLILSVFCVPIASNFKLGQVYMLLSLMMLVALQFLGKEKIGKAGVLIGMAAAIKYFPLVFFIYAKKKKWMPLLLVISSLILALWAVPVLSQGTEVYLEYFNVLLGHLNGNISGQSQYSFNYQSLDSLLFNLFVKNATFNPTPFIDMPFLKTIMKLLVFVSVVSILSIIYKKNKIQASSNYVGPSLILLGLSILFPASATYHFLLLIIPVGLLLIWVQKKFGNGKKLLLALFLSILSFNVLPHHVPDFDNSSLINTLIHFPRFFGLVGLFLTLSFYYFNTTLDNG